MSEHKCPGEGCLRCQVLIDEREFGDTTGGDNNRGAQDQYEAYLDRLGE